MKFDYIIGNPPYQDETIGENDTYAPPIYDRFIDATQEVGKKVELVHPARFLFNAGSTPKAWNRKMLEDPHYKVLKYYGQSNALFAGVDIKGGVAISYYSEDDYFGPIGIFTPYEELNSILHRVLTKNFVALSTIIITSYAYHLTEQTYIDNPSLKGSLSKGHEYDFKSNIFEKMPSLFFDDMPLDGHSYVRMMGRIGTTRIYKYVRKDYVNEVVNLSKYKVFMSGANGTGQYGETFVYNLGYPNEGSTETYLSVGSFDTEEEAKATAKYISSKFLRALLGVRKVTQALTPGKFDYVPLQDFTSNSDIDWSVSIKAIDQQLYKKYNLTDEEITFIETHVKEMS